jgi:hypothetical protein
LEHEDIVSAIDTAFADAEKPLTEDELAAPSIEAPYVIEHFLGKTRDDVESQRFYPSLYMEDFTYITDAAVLYYLPPVLRIMLAKPTDEELWIFLYAFLRGVADKHYPDTALTALNAAQRNAIADWAEHLAGEWASSANSARDCKQAKKLARMYRPAR